MIEKSTKRRDDDFSIFRHTTNLRVLARYSPSTQRNSTPLNRSFNCLSDCCMATLSVLLRENDDKFCHSLFVAGIILVATVIVMCPSCTAASNNNAIMNRSIKSICNKTVYLIRHAETEENVRMKGFHDIGKALEKGKLPSSSQLKLGSQFVGMTLSGNHNSKLSARGKQQVLQLQSILQDDDHHLHKSLDMIVHSPLQRAKETCYGIFKLTATATTTAVVTPDDADDNDSSTRTQRNSPPVVEVASLQEVTQWELKTQGKRPVRKRIKAFHEWLDGLDDDISTIAVVGHSEYFMIMLGMEEKFKNCDVWKATYQGGGNWTDLVNEVRLDMFSVECNEPGEEDDDDDASDVQCCGLGPRRSFR